MPGFQSTRLATEGALEPFFFLYTDDSIQGNPETCKQSSIMLNYEVKNNGISIEADHSNDKIPLYFQTSILKKAGFHSAHFDSLSIPQTFLHWLFPANGP